MIVDYHGGPRDGETAAVFNVDAGQMLDDVEVVLDPRVGEHVGTVLRVVSRYRLEASPTPLTLRAVYVPPPY